VAATSAQLDNPVGLAVDSAGNLYIADSHSDQNATTTQGLIAWSTRPASSAPWLGSAPPPGIDLSRGCSVDASGAIYVSDVELHTVSKFLNGVLTRTSRAMAIAGLRAMAVRQRMPSWEIPRAWRRTARAASTSRIRPTCAFEEVTPDGIISTIAGVTKDGYSGTADRALEAQMWSPHGVAVDASGNVYIARHRERRDPPIDPGESRHRRCHQRAGYQPQISPGALASVFGTGLSNATYQSAAPYPASWAHPAWRGRCER